MIDLSNPHPNQNITTLTNETHPNGFSNRINPTRLPDSTRASAKDKQLSAFFSRPPPPFPHPPARGLPPMSPPPAASIPLEDVARLPAPGMSFPGAVSFSPDGQLVAFLHSKQQQLSRQLYALDVTAKRVSLLAAPPNDQGDTERNLSLEERLRRERQRQMGVGITSYAWAPAGRRVLYPIQGDLFVQEHPGAPLALLFDKQSTGAAGGAIDPQLSPDGRWVAFVQDKELYVVPSRPASPGTPATAVQLTTGARGVPGRSHGLACFLTQEELSRFRGFWWSPDSTALAFEEIDEAHIPEFRIMHAGADVPTTQEDHRYPFAGDANPKRRLGVLRVLRHAASHGVDVLPTAPPPVTWMDFAPHVETVDDFYISRVHWLPDAALGVQTLNRLQTEAALLRFDPRSGHGTALLRETHAVWVNAHYLYRSLEPLADGGGFRFIWGSERSGFMHLYLYEFAGGRAELLGALTSGEWCVESIEGVDISSNRVFLCGTKDSPLERHLYAASLAPSEQPALVRLTAAEGMHSIVMDNACSQFVDVFSSPTAPPAALVCTVPSAAQVASLSQDQLFQEVTKSSFALHDDVQSRVKELQAQGKLPAPKLLEIPTRDGETTLFGAVYLPDREVHGDGPYPTLVSVYGGPHVQRVAKMWALTADMRAQRFRDMGYAVLKVDNRGSFRRGSHFEGAIKHKMGTVEILDQEDGVRLLVEQGIAAPGRVGIYGWSYGGYMAAISLLKAPETFKLAVAGAPVTSWDGYDTCYTERYMATPQLNPDGYRAASVMEAVPNMRAGQKLLLVHGLIDENVHFRHTARLIDALIRARKPYDLLLFPGERHSPRHLEDRVYMEQRIAEYVEAHL